MEPDTGPKSGYGQGEKYLGLGVRFAGGVVMFMLVGYGLDRWLGWTPVLTVTGTLLGACLSFLSVYRELMADEARARKRRQQEQPPR